MSLCKLPDKGYTYLTVESSEGHDAIWNSGLSGKDNAQFWLDRTIDDRKYELAFCWKFWKPIITFKVFACGGSVHPFYTTIKVQEI